MVVVLQFCHKDWQAGVKNLEWCNLWGKPASQKAFLAHDNKVPPEGVDRIRDLAGRYFSSVGEILYSPPKYETWPWAPNHAWTSVARKMPEVSKEPWLWWEMDAVPLRPDWLDDIEAEYKKGNMPFMGHIVQGVVPWGHMTGVGVYPNNVMQYTVQAFLQTTNSSVAWDVVMAKETVRRTHPANHLFQHVWTVNDKGEPDPAGKTIPAFHDWDDVAKGPHYVDFRKALFHRCKNHSLVDILTQHWKNVNTVAQSTEVNVPKHVTKVVEPEVKKKRGRPPKVKGSCEILIVTYAKDFPWLYYALKCIYKFTEGFSGVTLAIPKHDIPKLDPKEQPGKKDMRVRLYAYEEVPGKGMIQHEERIGCADEICPEADFILHMDADCMFHTPTKPSDYIKGAKPYYVARTYESLWDKNHKVVSDCYQWKAVSERTLGFPITMYTMCRHPTVFPRDLYPAYRKHVEKVHNMPFRDFVLSCKSTFPQTYAEFPSMGAFAWEFMRNRFEWVDCSNGEGPKDHMQNFWSHAGLDQRQDGDNSKPTPRTVIEGYLSK